MAWRNARESVREPIVVPSTTARLVAADDVADRVNQRDLLAASAETERLRRHAPIVLLADRVDGDAAAELAQRLS